MRYRRLEVIVLFAVVLVLNLLFSAWWFSGDPFPTAWAGQRAQEIEAAALVNIPSTFSYQGTLRDVNGNLINGTVNLTLGLYNVVTGGTPLHTETFDNVTVRAGNFSVVVGDVVAIASTVFDNYPLFLSISVNQDPELLPRQRLHPVPYAMQATSAQTALTANNLVQGGGVPNAVTLGAGGAKQIGFPDGGLITDSATGMTIRGGGANKTVTIDGDWSAGAILDQGDSNGGLNQRSTYPVSINRYVVEAPDNGASPDTVPVDGALLNQLCQDQDGCKVSLYMRDYLDNRQPGQMAGITSYHASLAPALNGKQEWNIHDPISNGSGGTDKDGVTQHLLNIYNDCFFTDGEYVNGSDQNDNALGFGLLNWRTTYTSPNMTCVLIIED